MDNIIYCIGVVVSGLLCLYLLLFVIRLILNVTVDSNIPNEAMPALRPVPIPTKKQKTLLHKIVVFIFEVRKWGVVENWHFKFDGNEIVIPKDFRFDGASIPRIFWAILNPIGLLLVPGLIHDYAYKYDQLWKIDENGGVVELDKGAGKEHWDKLFKEIGKDVNGFFVINVFAWLAVALGGKGAWNSHKKTHGKAKKPEL